MSGLGFAGALAAKAHKGLGNKAEEPYILRSMRAMLRMETSDDLIVTTLGRPPGRTVAPMV